MREFWQAPPSVYQLQNKLVHLWRVPFRTTPKTMSSLNDILNSEERARAARFKFTKDWQQFLVTRGVLRWILGKYLLTDPGSLVFEFGKYGKPFLGGAYGDANLNFNVSHSGDLALIGLVRGAKIGVDVERVRSDFGGEALAKRFFAEGEIRDLMSVPNSARKNAFYNGWTRKEAYLKARGGGLSTPLDEFEVVLKPGEIAAFKKVIPPEKIEDWTIHALIPEDGYAGAVVVEGVGVAMHYYKWTPDLR